MPTFIDLFAGCGGFSLGFRSAGLKSVAEIEVDEWACETLRHNFPESHVIQNDIRVISDETILSLGPVDVLIGGPPCQGFSVAGSTQFGVSDPRNELFEWFLHWAKILRPRIIIIENVPNILSENQAKSPVVDSVRHALEPLGYTIVATILNAADYGVPQSRRRAFIVATVPGVQFQFPRPTHYKVPHASLFESLQPYTTVGEALSDLPDIAAGEGIDEPVPYGKEATSRYQSARRKMSSLVTNHVAMKHTARLLERFRMIAPGKSLKDVDRVFGQIANRSGQIVDKPFKYNNYRLNAQSVSLAIPASFQSLFIHPTQHRNLTAREAARLMGFDDDFVFKGKRTIMSWEKHLSQYNQIGNAVCPPVAAALGTSVVRALGSSVVERHEAAGASLNLDRSSLQRPSVIPEVSVPISGDLLGELTAVASRLGKRDDYLNYKQLRIPSAALPLALIFATANECPMCTRDRAPFGLHNGEMCFLISKAGNDSLIENSNDHGLDYHLRVALGLDYQVAHMVGELLALSGVVDLRDIQNPRTGRQVRGFRVLDVEIDSALKTRVLDSLRRKAVLAA